ncbi:MAG: NlpC/P60 family protein [Ruminococcaceae bacterium]|nr:NlpC/P60 family protein [Oscillospiraceae bacterium]
MSRRIACLLLTLTVLCSSIAIVYADEAAAQNAAYRDAVETLYDAGMTYTADTAITDKRGMALPAQLGMLEQRSVLSLSELSTQALVLQQELQLRSAAEAEREAARKAFISLYDAVLITAQSANIYEVPNTEGYVLRTIGSGKVAKLLAMEDGFYHINFGKTTGYLPIADAQGAHFADYEGTLAVIDVTEAIIDYAYTYLGTPYAYGGSSYSGTDCSGFTMRVFAEYGYSLPHGCTGQYRLCTPVTTAERQRGDLVFFTAYGAGGFEHVGIYLGGGAFIHASSSKGVIVSYLSETYYAQNYIGAARLIAG